MQVSIAKHNIIQAIKERLPIQEAAARYMPELNLKQRGRRLWGCCPSHYEKTASFMIDTTKNRFFCFGCGIKGSQIDLVSLATGKNFSETKSFLADELGISGKLTPTEKETISLEIQQKKVKQKTRDRINEELALVFCRLSAFEKACNKNLKTYEDFERYPASVELMPIISGLLDEYLTFAPKRQISVWRYVKRRLPWLLTY